MEHKALFIDDEPLLREMYESLSPTLQGQYVIYTADNAEAASQLIRRERFEVIVTDIAMPGMDGLQFLSQVVFHQPDCPRIIISGYADQLKIAHCLFVGHRYFNKPCDLNALADLLLRLASFRGVMSNDKVRRVIGGLGSLPGPPETFLKLEALLQSSTSSVEDIAQLVEQDPVLTAKMLQIVNSAPLGLATKVYAVIEAVQHLGIATVRSLALGLHVFTAHHRRKGGRPPSPELWNHSLRVATTARAIARSQGFSAESCQRAFLAGLLHDIGKIVVHANSPEESTEVTDFIRRCEVPSVIAEAQRFRATYADIGAYLLVLWGIDPEVAAIVQYHERLDSFVVNDVPALAAVHVAHSLNARDPVGHPLQMEYLTALGFADADRWALEAAMATL